MLLVWVWVIDYYKSNCWITSTVTSCDDTVTLLILINSVDELVQDWFLCVTQTVWLLQAEDANVISDRWSVIFNNISVVIPQNSDCSSAHVRSLAELLLSTVVDCRCQQRGYFTFSVCTENSLVYCHVLHFSWMPHVLWHLRTANFVMCIMYEGRWWSLVALLLSWFFL